jgi:hypothetical protein
LMRYTVSPALSRLDSTTVRMRARITEGESRPSVGEGLVELLRYSGRT